MSSGSRQATHSAKIQFLWYYLQSEDTSQMNKDVQYDSKLTLCANNQKYEIWFIEHGEDV